MVSEFTSMMGVAIVEDQGGFHMMETSWDLVVFSIVQGKDNTMDNSLHSKDQSMPEAGRAKQ